jgi:hypothetical protein
MMQYSNCTTYHQFIVKVYNKVNKNHHFPTPIKIARRLVIFDGGTLALRRQIRTNNVPPRLVGRN